MADSVSLKPAKAESIVICSAVFSIALGAIIVFAWHNAWIEFLKLGRNFTPVHYYTGILFILSGLALLFIPHNKTKFPGVLFSLCGLAYSVFMAFQYIIFDTSVLNGLIVFSAPENIFIPSNIAPNTILCFLIGNGALFFYNLFPDASLKINAVVLPSVVTLTISFMSLAGYATGIEAGYNWWGYSGMALHAAYGIAVFSFGLIALAKAGGYRVRQFWPKRSILAGALGVVITMTLLQAILMHEKREEENGLRLQSAKIALSIKEDLQNSMNALLRMETRWEIKDFRERYWKADAENHIKFNPAYSSIALFDRDFKLQDVIGQNSAIDWTAITYSQKRVNNIPKSRHAAKSNRLILFYVPLKRDGQVEAILAAAYDPVLRANEFLLLNNKKIDLRIYQGSDLIHASQSSVSRGISKTAHFDFQGIPWKIVATEPNPGHSNKNLVLIVFLTGIGLSMLVANLLRQNEKIENIISDLRKTEERHELATSAANIGIWDWDIENERIIWAGNAWKILGGRNNNDLPATNDVLRARMPEEDRAAIDENIAKSARNDNMFAIEFRLRRLNDNKEIWILSSGKIIESREGKSIRSSGIIMDITERKEAEKYLLRSNHELEQFAYVASHDLKAPLRSIDNLAKWVIEDSGDAMPADAQEKLGLLRGRVSRLEALLNDILAYSRAGRITEAPLRIDVQTLFRSLGDIYVPKNFRFQSSSELQVIESPKTPLEQILGNLLSNAVKHHDKEAGTITLCLEDEAAFYKFTIFDDGPGIPIEFHDRVFQMFQTLQSRDRVDGSGLGMSIVKKLVEWQGGKVWIRPHEGRGTSICILWPKVSVSKHSVDVMN